MDILVVGYGKIGRIKSFIWRSLGRKVHVYDTDARKNEQAKADGFDLHTSNQRYGSDLVVDISTPASFHLASLEWVFNTISPRPRAILIEKPLASRQEELANLMRLLSREGLKDFRDRIIINESYYLSSALDLVANDIKKLSARIVKVRSELSKNRLEDVMNGRFVDEHLGSLGIELPHMIAMMQRLGISLGDLLIRDVSVYRAEDKTHNEGFRIELISQSVPVVMESYLGDFRVIDSGEITQNESIVRTLDVETNNRIYKVAFDPIMGLGRYKAKVCTYDVESNLINTTILDDDHLAKHLKKIHQNDNDQVLDAFFMVDNSLEITRYIFDLKANARYVSIRALPTRVENVPMISEVA
jgi:hypothetical protein